MRAFDLNEFRDKLRRERPQTYAVVSTISWIARAFWRIYVPMAVCFWLMGKTIATITADAGIRLTHFLPLILIAIILPFILVGDRRLQYDALTRRGGVASPAPWHDLGVMLGNLSFWAGVVCCLLAVVPNAPYMASEFALLMPEQSKGLQAIYAVTVPAMLVVLYYIAWWWLSMRIAYRFADPEEVPEPVQFAPFRRTLINGVAWVLGIFLLLFVGERALVFAIYTGVALFINYWQGFLILFTVIAVLVFVRRSLRVFRIRRKCIDQLKSEMDAAGVRYEFEKHPIRSAFFGGEKISLRIFIRDKVLSVRMISSFKKKVILIVAPDGNIGFLHSIGIMRLPIRSSKLISTPDGGKAEQDSPALTQWMIKRETVFEDEKYPDAEKIYLMTPTPTDWRMGELKKTVPLNNGSEAYGYRMWTTSAFCRHIRLRSAGEYGINFEDLQDNETVAGGTTDEKV